VERDLRTSAVEVEISSVSAKPPRLIGEAPSSALMNLGNVRAGRVDGLRAGGTLTFAPSDRRCRRG
jgi:hypothetical protein